VLGEGNYGRVKLVVHRASGFSLALKTMHKARITAKRQTSNVLREAAILHGVAHPFVLRCVCTFQTRDQVMMLLELVQAGDLWPYIYRKKVPKFFNALPRSAAFGGFVTAHARFYAANLVAALEYIHGLGIAYRDLKPEVWDAQEMHTKQSKTKQKQSKNYAQRCVQACPQRRAQHAADAAENVTFLARSLACSLAWSLCRCPAARCPEPRVRHGGLP